MIIRRTDSLLEPSLQLSQTAAGGHWQPVEYIGGTFVCGPENALLRVVECSLERESGYNPVLLEGLPGSGKTQLLEIFSQAHQAVHPRRLICSYTGTDYQRAVKAAANLDAMTDLRRRHRQAHLFILDGVHQLSEQLFAQQELLHTFDRLLKQERQILLSTSQPLNHIPGLLPQLVSRLQTGLVVPIELPGSDARRELIVQFARQHDLSLNEDVIDSLVQLTAGSEQRIAPRIRSLILRLSQQRRPVTRRVVKTLVEDTLNSTTCSSKQIIAQVARHYAIRVAELSGPSRKQTTVLARGLAIFLIRNLKGSSFAQIGLLLGGRDHSTVLHAYRRIEQSSLEDVTIQQALSTIAGKLDVALPTAAVGE